MGFLKNALKSGLVIKAIDIARREAAKPENQRKAKELLERLANRTRQANRNRNM
jgi:hypothetical protein